MSSRRFVFNTATALAVLAPLISYSCLRAEDTPAPATAAVLTNPLTAPASETHLADAISKTIRSTVERAAPAVCRIEGDDEHGRLSGSGFLLDADGTLITSYSVGGTAEDLVVTVGEERYPAVRLTADERSGIALLRVEADKPLPFLKPGEAMKLEMGSPIVVLGYPAEQSLSPSFGLVASFECGCEGRYFAARHIRATAPVQKGQGGAPVLNLKGEVVGVLISTQEGGGLFSLPIEAAQKLVHDFHKYGRMRQGWLGADVRVSDAPESGSNARIRGVRNGGPGHKGGIRSGDVLLQIGRWPIHKPEDVLNAAFYLTANEPVKIRVSRAGREQEFSVTPTDPPDGEGPTVEHKAPSFLGSTKDGLDIGN